MPFQPSTLGLFLGFPAGFAEPLQGRMGDAGISCEENCFVFEIRAFTASRYSTFTWLLSVGSDLTYFTILVGISKLRSASHHLGCGASTSTLVPPLAPLGPLSPNSSWPASIYNRPANFGQMGVTFHFLPGIRLRFKSWKPIAEAAGKCQIALGFYTPYTYTGSHVHKYIYIYMPTLVCQEKMCLCVRAFTCA